MVTPFHCRGNGCFWRNPGNDNVFRGGQETAKQEYPRAGHFWGPGLI